MINFKKNVLKIIKIYQNLNTNFFPFNRIRLVCRFSPTCSEYTYQAISKYGTIKGSILALWRILRCQPFCRGGNDPVR